MNRKKLVACLERTGLFTDGAQRETIADHILNAYNKGKDIPQALRSLIKDNTDEINRVVGILIEELRGKVVSSEIANPLIADFGVNPNIFKEVKNVSTPEIQSTSRASVRKSTESGNIGAEGAGVLEGELSQGRGERPEAGTSRSTQKRSKGKKRANKQTKSRGTATGSRRNRYETIHTATAPEARLEGEGKGVAGVPPAIPKTNIDLVGIPGIGKGSIQKKFEDNLAAIKLLKEIEAEGRRATREEQEILARYVGWGGIPQAFKNSQTGEYSKGWEDRAKELEELLTEEELKAARTSTRNAHYTSPAIIRGMWEVVTNLGLNKGLALEPTAGIGHFLGYRPKNLQTSVPFIAIELDSISARIAKQLYQSEAILSAGFEDVALPTNTFDLVIGNPPFGQERLSMKYFPEFNRFSIHNQILLSSMKTLKPGGVMAVVVSRYFMDSKDASARKALSNVAHFLGGVRLPDMAFKENANTEVVTDILFFVKKNPEQDEKGAGSATNWLVTSKVDDPLGGEPMTVNNYFVEHPEMIVGSLERSGSMYGKNEVNVSFKADKKEFPQKLRQALANITPIEGVTPFAKQEDSVENILRQQRQVNRALLLAMQNKELGHISYNKAGQLEQVYAVTLEDENIIMGVREVRVGIPWSPNIFEDDKGRLFKIVPKLDEEGKKIKEGRRIVYEKQYIEDASKLSAAVTLTKKKLDILKSAVKIRDLVYRQIELETADKDQKAIKENRAKLNEAYDKHVEKYGYLNDATTKRLINGMPDVAMLLSLEQKYKKPITESVAKRLGVSTRPSSAQKADIFRKKVVQSYKPPITAENPVDALAISLAETGRVDINRMASLLNKSKEDTIKALHDDLEKPLIFYDPEQEEWVERSEYLSGNVVRKFEAAKQEGLAKNIEELEKVLPEPWTSDQITPIMGASWIPEDVYADFLNHLLGTNDATVRYLKKSNSFVVSHQDYTQGNAVNWQTERKTVGQIVHAILNSRKIMVRDTWKDETGYHSVINPEATEEANNKADEIKEEFLDWVFSDSERRRRLTKAFNEKFNNLVLRQRDGSHLVFPGKVPDVILAPRQHQKNAAWRGITDRVVLYDHVVGSGKTITSILRVMERKRMGIARKPMITVPNHIVNQFAQEFYRLYPKAKLLVASEADTQKARRRLFFAKIANNEWDAIIIPHSMFEFINLSPEKEEEFLREDLNEAIEALTEAQQVDEEENPESRFKSPTVKKAEALVAKLKGRLQALRDKMSKGERFVTFEQMGIDDLTVDEAHLFKNLFYMSNLQVKGMNTPQGSQRALDLYNKTRYLHQINGGIAFLTGTPVSNSAVEMYNLMRYLRPDLLKERGIEHFDSWRSQFVSVTTQLEPTESGRGLKTVDRLGVEWFNMRSLMNLYYSFADTVTNDDIIKWYEENNPGERYPLPKIKNGKRTTINIKPTPYTEEIMRDIVDGFEALSSIRDPIERAAERFRLMDRARKVSLDPRLLDPIRYKDEKGGKLDAVVEQVKRIYDEWEHEKGTQLVFLDRGVKANNDDIKRLKQYDKLVKEMDEAIEAGDEERIRKLNNKLEGYNAAEMEGIRTSVEANWNAYDEIKNSLVKAGIPANEIRFIQEANTPQQKQELFEAVNEGAVRVLIGSTPRMGAGTNVQERLVALHHVDVGWKPSDIEQREGRIIRQGNSLYEKEPENFAVEILAYTVESTVDAKMWDLNYQKLKMINSLRNYKGEFSMEFVDEDALDMAEIAAIASGEPLQVERVKLTAEIERLQRQRRSFLRQKYANEDRLERIQKIIETAPQEIKQQEDAFEYINRSANALIEQSLAKRKIKINDKEFGYEDFHGATAEIDSIKEDRKEQGKKFFAVINGEEVSSYKRALGMVQESLGDPSRVFVAKWKGKEYIRIKNLAEAIAKEIKKLAPNVDGEIIKDSWAEIKVPGGKLTLDLQLTPFDQTIFITKYLESGPGEFIEYDSDQAYRAIKTDANVNEVSVRSLAPAISRVASFNASTFKFRIDRLKKELARAKEDLEPLREAVKKEWPKQEEYDEKQERLAEIEAQLNEDEGANQASEEPRASITRQTVPEHLQANVPEEAEQYLGKKHFEALRKSGLVNIITPEEAERIINSDARKATAGQISNFMFRKGLAHKKIKGGHPTQIATTVSTYKKIKRLMPEHVRKGTILDYGAGLGKGAKIFKAVTFEPFPREDFKPDYRKAEEIPLESFDGIILNNVLNVVPDDIRKDIVLHVGDLLKPGGYAYINVRGKDIFEAKDFEQVSPSEIIIKSTGAYQKAFTTQELKEYLQKTLGPGFEVKIPKGKERFGKVSAIVRRLQPTELNFLGPIDTESEGFRRWFKGSKVTHSSGEPKIVYHGAYRSGFSWFDPGKAGLSFPGQTVSSTVWFAENPHVANFFASESLGYEGRAPAVYPAYLSLKNPLIVDMANPKELKQYDVDWNPDSHVFKLLDGRKIYSIGTVKRNAVGKAWVTGHDGVIFKNGFDGVPTDGDIYVIFRPESAKSAISNTGAFSNEPQIFRSSDGATIQGFYLKGKVYLIQGNITKGDVPRLLLHELGVHARNLGFINEKAYRRLLESLPNRAMKDDAEGRAIKEAMAMVPPDTDPKHYNEEILAYLIQTGRTHLSVIRRLFALLKKFLVEKLGFPVRILNNADLSALALHAIRSREEAGKQKRKKQLGLFEYQEPVQKKPTAPMAALHTFKPLPKNPMTLASFRAWFGQSKITRKGQPLKMYHGSDVPIWTFDKKRLGKQTGHLTAPLGFFFTPKKKEAKHYGPELTTVYLKVERPFVVTAAKLADKIDSHKKAIRLREILQKQGYDGIILKENGHVIVFEPEQIKSAELSTGEFSGSNPDIRFSVSQAQPVKDHVVEKVKQFEDDFKDAVGMAQNLFQQINPLAKDKYSMEGPRDTNLLDRLFALPAHYFEKVPALKRVYDAAVAGREYYAHYVDAMTREKTGEYRTTILNELQRKNKAGFNKLARYLVEADQRMIGWTVRLNPKTQEWQVFSPHEEGATGRAKTEGEAWRLAIRQEAQWLQRNRGWTPDMAKALIAFRETTHAGFEILTAQLRAIIAMYEKQGLELKPDVYLTDKEGNVFKGTLRDALAMMGDLRGFYFPRIHKPGAFVVYAKSPVGEHRIFKYDIKKLGEAKVVSLRQAGWEAELVPSSQLPESVFDLSKNVLNAQAVINAAIERLEVETIDDVPGLRIQRDGEDLVITGPASTSLNKVFKSFGGRFFQQDNAWHFEKIGKRAEKRLARAIIFEQNKADASMVAIFNGMVNEQVANVFKARGGRARMIRRNRKVVWKGYEENPAVALAQYVSGIAATEAKKKTAISMLLAFTGQDVSWNEFQAAWGGESLGDDMVAREKFEAVQKFKGDKKDLPDYMDYIAFQKQRMVHPRYQKNAYEDGRQYMQTVLRNKEAADRIFGIFAGLAMIKYLGLRPSSVLVNLTALLTNAPAAISGYSNKNLTQASLLLGDSFSSFYKYWKYKRTGKKPAGLTEEDIRAFEYMEEKGWTSDQFNREAMSALYSKLGRAYKRMVEKAMWAFKVSEQFNRYSTIKAAYEAIKDMPEYKGDFEAAMHRAREISDKAHGVYGKVNQPHYVQNRRLFQALYVFQTFIHNYWNTLYDLGVSKKAIKPAIYMALSPAILSGMTVGASRLLVKAIMAAIKKAFGLDDPEEDYYNWLYNTFGIAGPAMSTLARQGIFGLAGVDLSGSLEATPRAPKEVTDWFGAPGAVVVDFVRGSRMVWRGDIMKGFERILPIAFGNLVKAYRESQYGVTKRNNAPIFDQYGQPLKLTTVEMLWEAAGFNPARKAQVREIDWHKKRVKQEYAEKRSSLYARLRKAYLEYDVLPDDVWAEFVKEIEEYNMRASRSDGIIPLITQNSIKRAIQSMYRPPK